MNGANGASRGSLVRAVLAEHVEFVLIIVLSTVALLWISMSGISPGATGPLSDLPSAFLALGLTADLVLLAIVWRRVSARQSWGAAVNDLRGGLLRSERIIGLTLVTFATRWLLLTAVAWKSALPSLHPFCCDESLARLSSRVLGRPAWEFLEPLTRSSLFLHAADLFYYLWFAAFAWVMLVVAWGPYSARRRRFLIGMALTWTVGSLLAIAVSSAGPVYFSRVTGDASSFDLLANRLMDHQLLAAGFQQVLWDNYQGQLHGAIAGIAAFPSLHVAVPAYLALNTRPGSWRRAAWLLTLATWFCSVLLGWHYLVDGPGGILVATAAWVSAGLIQKARS